MKESVEFPMEAGGSIQIEVEDAKGLKPVARGAGRTVKEAKETFETALEGVKGVANSLHAQLSGMDIKPDSVSVEFGIKLSASAGVIIASGGGEANFKISMTWNA
jgi:inner membrane protein involved in colicin E2 resistance